MIALTLTDPDVWKILCALAASIGHLYWQAFRCRDAHDKTKARLAKLETTVAGCPHDNCPLIRQDEGTVSFSIRKHPNHPQTNG